MQAITQSLWSPKFFRNSAFPVPIWGRHNKTNATQKKRRVFSGARHRHGNKHEELNRWAKGEKIVCLQSVQTARVDAWLTVFLACFNLKTIAQKDGYFAAGSNCCTWKQHRHPWTAADIRTVDVSRQTQQASTLKHAQPQLLLHSAYTHTHTHTVHAVVGWNEQQEKKKNMPSPSMTALSICRKHHNLQELTRTVKCGTTKTDYTKALPLSYVLHSRYKCRTLWFRAPMLSLTDKCWNHRHSGLSPRLYSCCRHSLVKKSLI